MPMESQAQRRAMYAAAAGHSTLGIPKSVGQEFVSTDKPGKLPARAPKAEGGKTNHKPKGPPPHIHIHLPPPPPILMMPRREAGGVDLSSPEARFSNDSDLFRRLPINEDEAEPPPHSGPLPRDMLTYGQLKDRERPGAVSMQGSAGYGGNAREPPGGVIMLRERIPLGDNERFAGGSVGHGVGGTVTEPDGPPGMPSGGAPPKPMAVGGIPRLGGHIPHMAAPRGMGMEKLGLSTAPGSGGLGRFASGHFDYGGDVHEHMAAGGLESASEGFPFWARAAAREEVQAPQAFNAGKLPTTTGGALVPPSVMPVNAQVQPKIPDPYALKVGPYGTPLPEMKRGRGPEEPSVRLPSPFKEPPQVAKSGGIIHDMAIKHGMFPGDGGGRTDRLPSQVDVGSYVIPADVVSTLGQGHTAFGDKVLRASIGDEHGHMAHGGRPSSTSILAAPGEFCVSREAVDALGQRGLEQGFGKKGETATNCGHRLLDELIARARKFQIAWLRHAPPPKKQAGGAVTMGLGFSMAA